MTAPRFGALTVTAELDSALAKLRHRRQTLPERQQLRDLARDTARAAAQRDEAAALLDDAAGRERVLEDELAAAEARIKTVEGRMYGGTVTASRDLQAMAADVAVSKARVSTLEDRVLEALEERQPLDSRVAELDAGLADLEAQRVEADERLSAGEGSLDSEEVELGRRRVEAAAGVDAELSALYERLRARLGGVGAAHLVGDRCDGCHLTLPATELDRLRHQPPDAIVTCEQCGRILIRA